jgi:hypothetical protein
MAGNQQATKATRLKENNSAEKRLLEQGAERMAKISH